MVMSQSNGSGQLDWEEFQELWKRFRTWTVRSSSGQRSRGVVRCP